MSISTYLAIETRGIKTPEGEHFTIDPGDPEGIFCDSEGSRPGSFLVGIWLKPVVICPGSNDSITSGSLYCDACGRKVNDVPRNPIPVHEATPEVLETYGINVSHGAIYLDVTRDELVALQAMLQRVLDDNPEEVNRGGVAT